MLPIGCFQDFVLVALFSDDAVDLDARKDLEGVWGFRCRFPAVFRDIFLSDSSYSSSISTALSLDSSFLSQVGVKSESSLPSSFLSWFSLEVLCSSPFPFC